MRLNPNYLNINPKYKYKYDCMLFRTDAGEHWIHAINIAKRAKLHKFKMLVWVEGNFGCYFYQWPCCQPFWMVIITNEVTSGPASMRIVLHAIWYPSRHMVHTLTEMVVKCNTVTHIATYYMQVHTRVTGLIGVWVGITSEQGIEGVQQLNRVQRGYKYLPSKWSNSKFREV